MQTVRFSRNTATSFSANLTHSNNDQNSFIDNNGNRVGSSGRNMTRFALGVTQSWLLGAWKPTVGLGYSFASKEQAQGSGDKDAMTWSMGISRAVLKKANVGLTYSSSFNQHNVKQNTVSLTFSQGF